MMEEIAMLKVIALIAAAFLALALNAALAGQEDLSRTRDEVEQTAAGVLARCGDRQQAEWGILDVTKAPYRADPTGARDSTRAIQQAVLDGRDARLVVYFPPGVYLVSDTIRGIQGHVMPSGQGENRLRNEDFPCVLWGSTRGGRARLRLAPNSVGFGDPQHIKPVLFLSARNWEEPYDLEANVSFNQMILSLDVEIGPGNPGAVGIDHQAAQGSVVEDVAVAAGDGFAGFRGAPGSGGSMAHVAVTGGRYGLYLAEGGPLAKLSGSQPSPVVSHVRLAGQRAQAVLYRGRGPLTLVGARIEGAGIRLEGPAWAPYDGALNVVDSVIRHEGAGAAIEGNRPVCLNNVLFEGAGTPVRLDGAPALASRPGGKTLVAEYAAGPGPLYPVWIDGRRTSEPIVRFGEGAPPDPLALHDWPRPLPEWDDEGVVNARREPYGARGDGKTDDVEALQKALDSGRPVLLPKGIYKVSRPLVLGARGCLFGLGVYSIISPISDAPAFTDPEHPQPVIATANDAGATTALAFVQIWCRIPGAYALHWQAGRASLVRDVRFKHYPPEGSTKLWNHPFVLVDGNGGGRWYNGYWSGSGQGSDYRHFLARGTREPLAFTMFNPEHASSSFQTEFDDVRDVSIYGMKAETIPLGPIAKPPLLLRNSQRFRLFGYGGNASAAAGDALIHLQGCSDFLLANLGQQHMKTGAAPATWSIVAETLPSGEKVRVPATEFPVMYQRGRP